MIVRNKGVSKMPANTMDRNDLLAIWNEYAHACARIGAPEPDAGLKRQLMACQLGLFRLVVVGEVKKGKSSLISALLGEDNLLPVSSDVATSTVFKIMYGPQRKVKVFFKNQEGGTGVSGPLEVMPEEISDYGTEDGNPSNQKNVDFIGVEHPHPLLKSGLVIIDTPGLGGLFRKHAEITWRHIPSADAVFFVLDSVESVITRDERDFLSKIHAMVPLVFFVQTKIDLVEKEKWSLWRERNLEVISATLEKPAAKICYFPVSARLKLRGDKLHDTKYLERSGFLPLLEFVSEKLLKAKDVQLGRRLLAGMDASLAFQEERLGELARISESVTAEDADRHIRALNERQAALEQWERGGARKVLSDFQYDLKCLQQSASHKMAKALSPVPEGAVVHAVMAQSRENPALDVDKLDQGIQDISAACINECNQHVLAVFKEVEKGLKDLDEKFANALGESLGLELSAGELRYEEIRMKDSVGHGPGWFETHRQVMYGGMAGVMMLQMAMAPVGFLFPPAAAIISIAPCIGGAIGMYLTSKNCQRRQREETLAKIQGALIEVVRQVCQLATARLQREFLDVEHKASESLARAIASRRCTLREAIRASELARKQTVAERLESRKTLEGQLQMVRSCRERMKKLG